MVKAERILIGVSENVSPNYCQKNLSEGGGGKGCGERQELKLFFQEKQKAVQGRKLIIGTLCALSENSVYIVLMLNMDLTKIEM